MSVCAYLEMKYVVRLMLVAAICVCYTYVTNFYLKVLDHSPIYFTVASYYSDYMVLQKEPYSATIWGFCEKNGKVTAKLEQTANVYVGQLEDHFRNISIWTVSLPPQAPGGPYNISITYTSRHQHTKTSVISNVLFGDVWFCSGQSNMKRPLHQLKYYDVVKAYAKDYQHIRYFQVEKQNYSATPNIDLAVKNGQWLRLNKDGNGKTFSALCWLFGQRLYDELKYPIGLVESSVSGTSIQQWSSYEDLQKCNAEKMDVKKEGSHRNFLLRLREKDRSSLWNVMIYPFLRMVIRGIIWYQGENNIGFHRDNYNCTFPKFINRVRNEWSKATKGNTDQELPFGFVQLPGYGADPDMFWSWLRWHQTADYGFVPNNKMSNTFMAVAIDLPDKEDPKFDLHPRDKITIADRLSWAALNHVYGKTRFPASSPKVVEKAITYEHTGKILLKFDQPIILKKASGFKYCCKKTSEYCSMDPNADEWIEVIDIDQNSPTSVLLHVECKPSELSYAWKGLPCYYKQCPIYSNDTYQLPVAPWRWQFRLE